MPGRAEAVTVGMETRRAELQRRAGELGPWRYNHAHEGVVIKSDYPPAARAFEEYGRDLLAHILRVLVRGRRPEDLRALDLGCLEGHYSDILCSVGFKEVVSIDLSEGHVRRATFLLQELKRRPNSTVLLGNASDESFMGSLGTFNLVLFHGLLYHLKDPLKAFDIFERLIPEDGEFTLLLSTQYKGRYDALVSPFPLAEMQVKGLKPQGGQRSEGLLLSPSDGSVFERCSFRLNPAAVYAVLRAYGYKGIIAYDDPGGHSHSFHSNLLVTKERVSGRLEELNKDLRVPRARFYDWDGMSVNSYDFRRRMRARIARFIVGASSRLIERMGL